MQGNNESNIDFDVDNGLIEKGKTTGGRFDSWVAASNPLPIARWNHASAAYGGYMYVMGGNSGSAATGSLYWSQIDSSTGDIVPANPSGEATTACVSWCTSSDYNLPAGAVRQGAQLIAYNGYLYLLGGTDSTGTYTNTVYIAKLGANGEPQLWHPSDSNKANWVYWYQDTGLSSVRAYFGAVAYNNRLYVVGGKISASSVGTTTVERADITPTGVLSGWTSVTALGAGNERYGMGVQVYNDRLYVVGGANNLTTQNTIFYTKINNDGSLNSWLTGTAIQDGGSGGARASLGGTMTTIWGGYIYVAGGCRTISGTVSAPYCASANIANDIQLASINADGSVTDWTTILGVTNSRTSYSLVSWRNRLYAIGGCASQTTTGTCDSTLTNADRGNINPDGDASTVNTSAAVGTAPCSGTTPTNCDMPPAGKTSYNGQMTGAAVVNNGFIYYIGGCAYTAQSSVCINGNAGKAVTGISYASIAADGSVVAPPSCAGTLYGSWCAISTGLPVGLAAFGYTVFNNTLYIIGGTTGTTWQANIYNTKFNANGTWGTWSTAQTFSSVGISAAAIGYPYVFARANPSAASTNPGNIYIVGGCYGNLVDPSVNGSGLDCSGTFLNTVYKCNIGTTGTLNSCSTTDQLQLDAEPQTTGNQGLGTMAGTVYANYVYLIGGQSPNEEVRGEVLYAKIDNNNNLVAVPGETTWKLSPYQLNPVRRRGVAFGYNGYIYALAGYNVNNGGSLNDLLYAKVNVSDGSISDFRTSSVTVIPRWDLRAAVNNGYVYAMGGCNVGAPPASCTSMTGTVQTFQLYNNYSGSPKGYVAGSQYPTDRYGASATILNGYVYMAGGCTSAATDCSTATNSVVYAPIQADGTLGTWTATQNLLLPLAWGKLEAVGGTLYYIGGQTSGSNNGSQNIYWVKPDANGAITTTWASTANGLPSGRTRMGAAVWNDRIYIVGGNSNVGTPTNTVYVSPPLTGGGTIPSAWSTASTSLPVARNGATVIAYANNLYVYGGYNGAQYLNDTNYAQIDGSTGNVGSWTYGTSLPTNLRDAEGFAANGFMYLFGGRSDNTTCNSNTIVAPISANTTIASGNNPTGIGDWYATNIRYSGNRYGAAVVYNEGKVFVMGGQCNGTMIGTAAATDRVQYSTVQSQPQLARYSRMIDTDSDVFPSKFLLNGLDNSIGARWYLRYRSMTNPYATNQCSSSVMSTWGQEYNFGQVNLGLPGTYTPLDGSGTNTNCARFYYLSVNIDSSQAYGYPEDVSRGPTITDLSLFFTADPSKRLMHGRTFTGGLQQPDDTPIYPN